MIESMHKRSHTVTMMSWEMQLFAASIFKQSGTAQIQASLSFDRDAFYILRDSKSYSFCFLRKALFHPKLTGALVLF